jgi:hypothetical protein
MVPTSQTRGGPQTEGGPPERKGAKLMRTYYWKVFRHFFSTAVLAGFIRANN